MTRYEIVFSDGDVEFFDACGPYEKEIAWSLALSKNTKHNLFYNGFKTLGDAVNEPFNYFPIRDREARARIFDGDWARAQRIRSDFWKDKKNGRP